MKLSPEEKTKITNLLQKLLALATSPNEHEAQLAMEKATSIMEKYSLSMLDIPENGSPMTQEEALMKGMCNEVVGGMGKFQMWESVLAAGISKAFDCITLNRKYQGAWGEWGIIFIGQKGDVEIAKWLHLYVRRSVGKISKIEVPREGKDRESFKQGMVTKIAQRLADMYQRRNEISTCKALIVVKKDTVEKYLKQEFPNVTTGRPWKTTGSRDAWMRGAEAGSKLSLNKPVAGERRKELP